MHPQFTNINLCIDPLITETPSTNLNFKNQPNVLFDFSPVNQSKEINSTINPITSPNETYKSTTNIHFFTRPNKNFTSPSTRTKKFPNNLFNLDKPVYPALDDLINLEKTTPTQFISLHRIEELNKTKSIPETIEEEQISLNFPIYHQLNKLINFEYKFYHEFFRTSNETTILSQPTKAANTKDTENDNKNITNISQELIANTQPTKIENTKHAESDDQNITNISQVSSAVLQTTEAGNTKDIKSENITNISQGSTAKSQPTKVETTEDTESDNRIITNISQVSTALSQPTETGNTKNDETDDIPETLHFQTEKQLSHNSSESEKCNNANGLKSILKNNCNEHYEIEIVKANKQDLIPIEKFVNDLNSKALFSRDKENIPYFNNERKKQLLFYNEFCKIDDETSKTSLPNDLKNRKTVRFGLFNELIDANDNFVSLDLKDSESGSDGNNFNKIYKNCLETRSGRSTPKYANSIVPHPINFKPSSKRSLNLEGATIIISDDEMKIVHNQENESDENEDVSALDLNDVDTNYNQEHKYLKTENSLSHIHLNHIENKNTDDDSRLYKNYKQEDFLCDENQCSLKSKNRFMIKARPAGNKVKVDELIIPRNSKVKFKGFEGSRDNSNKTRRFSRELFDKFVSKLFKRKNKNDTLKPILKNRINPNYQHELKLLQHSESVSLDRFLDNFKNKWQFNSKNQILFHGFRHEQVNKYNLDNNLL
ncbi:hypothetical protein KGF54_005670 [Candida jiufengensis]|uniref:uncharacterized protein n=1 Tax=Candida jiufengensis TaxID=497108 RepID=UPI002224C3D2|nr:uncharacterized protein KGF54_005670 [Candida jiufengensis]KAI5949435.1 hypothetical protein KGF54_005670 [Candida jiufengensis]